VTDRSEKADWRTTYPLGRRLRRDQFRVVVLDRAQLVHELVKLGVADLGLVQLVVTAVMVGDQLTQLSGPRCQSVVSSSHRDKATGG
jgi:hypothetical protein